MPRKGWRLCSRAIAFAALLLCLVPSEPGQVRAQDRVIRPQLYGAVWHDGAVFTYDSEGLLQRWEPEAQVGIPVETPGLVHSICDLRGQLFVATLNTGNEKIIRLSRRTSDGWEDVAHLDVSEAGRPVGLACNEEEPLLLTANAVNFAFSGRQVSVSGLEPRMSGDAVLFQQSETLWLGFDLGEFGGGLHSIDLASGRFSGSVTPDNREQCEGLCGPVHGILEDPADASCIIVAIGLAHFIEQGFLARMCPDGAENIRSIAVTPSRSRRETAAFTALARRGDRAFALARGVVHIRDQSGEFETFSLDLATWPFEQRFDWSNEDVVIIDGDPIQREDKYTYTWLLVARPEASDAN